MNEPQDLEQALQARFPEMRPIKRAPALFTLNGCGAAVYGARDRDPETGTYVKTHCVVVVFIPVLAIGAYRVADGPSSGWAFLGKVPLSPLAKGWNWLLAAIVAAALGWGMLQEQWDSPEYRAQQVYEAAQAAEAAGQHAQALEGYAQLIHTPKAADGRAALQRLLQEWIGGLPPAQAAPLVSGLLDTPHQDLFAPAQIARLVERAVETREEDPRASLSLLDALAQVGPDAVAPAREQVLEVLVARDPADPEATSQLAVIYEAREELARCRALLEPARGALRAQEGARILGQLLAREGSIADAHALLGPYVDDRLVGLRDAEAAMDRAYEQALERAIGALDRGAAPRAWYARYEAATQEEQQAMVRAWIQEQAKTDTALDAARQRLASAARVVPVALDLGIVKLQHAQRLGDPAARQAELQAAEEVFLAVGGVAGESLQYKLNLGKVRFWLGKEGEGRELFEELLAANERSALSLLLVARTLREVGASQEAAELAEESYEAAGDDLPARHAAASFRALFAQDVDEEVLWLGRSDPEDPQVRANLSGAKGRQALAQGDDAGAAEHFRASIATFLELPESASSLNNAALSHQRLYQVTGESAEFEQYVELVLRAEGLQPGDTILLGNAAWGLAQRAILGVIDGRLDLAVLRSNPSQGHLAYLMEDEAAREAVEGAYAAHPDVREARRRAEQLLVLAPKSATPYHLQLQLLGPERDLAAHQALRGALERADLEGRLDAAREAFARESTPEEVAEFATYVAKTAAVVETARAGPPATLAAAIAAHVATGHGSFVLGQPVDADPLVALAEEGFQTSPSLGMRYALVGALMLRATLRGCELPAGAELRARCARAIPITTLVPAVLRGGDGPLREALAGDPDLGRAAELVAEACARFPRERTPWAWAFLNALGHPGAEAVGAHAREDEVGRIRAAIRLRLAPLDAEEVFSNAWAAELAGKPEEAAAGVARAVELGLPWSSP